jgi:hypothetical protein
MFILIFDTNAGLCNQFYDIVSGINFCLKYNIFFTFRYCSFRNDDLKTWYNQPFENLFDVNLFNKYDLYVNYHSIKDNLTDNNCFNLNGDRLAYFEFKSDDIFNQLTNLNKRYIVLKQFWPIYNFQDIIDNTIYNNILPSKHIMDKYIEIRNTLVNEELYNFIHYRYEIDFTDFFKIKIENLDDLIQKINFKNNALQIYIATSNIKNLINLHDNKYQNILYKDDELLLDFNYEERAFIDYMFGLNSVECYGHNMSSFSIMINNLKETNNYYNLI